MMIDRNAKLGFAVLSPNKIIVCIFCSIIPISPQYTLVVFIFSKIPIYPNILSKFPFSLFFLPTTNNQQLRAQGLAGFGFCRVDGRAIIPYNGESNGKEHGK